MRDHLEGLEKEAKPVPDPNWLGWAAAVLTEGADVGVDDLLVVVRAAAVVVPLVVEVAVVGPWLRLLLVAAALELNWDEPLISFWIIGKNPDLA